MFGCLKTMIALVVVLGVVVAGLAYLPADKSVQVASKAAGIAVKGCRGGKVLLQAFASAWSEESGE